MPTGEKDLAHLAATIAGHLRLRLAPARCDKGRKRCHETDMRYWLGRGVVPMRVTQTFFACRLLAGCLLGLALNLAGLGAGVGHAEAAHPLTVTLSFDRPINAAEAPVVVAMTDGLFAAEGLSIITNMMAGSPEAIARVASGASEFAVVDLNALIRFRSQSSPPVKAVFVLFNKAPYAIVARKNRGIHVLSDLEGKTLGIADG